MESLEANILTLKGDISKVRSALLDPLLDSIDPQKNNDPDKPVSLCMTARVYKLETVVGVWRKTIDAVETFMQEENVMKEIRGSKMLKTMVEEIIEETEDLDSHCTFRLPVTGLAFISGEDIESHINTIHTHVEAILLSLKKVAHEMEAEGILKKVQQQVEPIEEEEGFYKSHRQRAGSPQIQNIRLRHAVSCEESNTRKMSFVGRSSSIPMIGKHGQGEALANALLVDVLLLELPMKYKAK